MIKMYDFKNQYLNIKNKIDYSSIQSVLNDSAFFNEKYVQNLKINFQNILIQNILLQSIMELRLYILLFCCITYIGNNDEVLVPSFSFLPHVNLFH